MGDHPLHRSSASRGAEQRGRRGRFLTPRGDGDGRRGVGRTRGCPGRGRRAYRKAHFVHETQGAKRPPPRARLGFFIAKSHRDGENHAPRALDALEACSKKLDSYLILHGCGNNHRYDGAKKHRVVTPRFSIAPRTHATHLLVSLDTHTLEMATWSEWVK